MAVPTFATVGYLNTIIHLKGEDNLGGLQQIMVCRKADITLIPDPVGGIVYGDITFGPGGAFVQWDVTLESSVIQSQEVVTKEGSSKRNSLAFTIPKGRSDLRNMFTRMEKDEFVVLFLENGKQKLFGQLHAPVLFSFSHSSGKKFSDLNAFEGRFYYDGPDNVFYYDGDTGTPPAGPAPSIVMFNGEVIASLQPGETLNILSDYSFSEYFTTS